MPYMTPAFLKRMNIGIDLSGTSDEEIARLLDIATSAVNRETAAPTYPSQHDFRGGTITSEQHTWDLGNNYRVGSDRVYTYHWPVKAVSSFTLRVTSTQTVTFDPVDIYINRAENYMEIISLARRLSVFSAGFVPVLGLRQPVAEVNYSYGRTFSVTGERMYPDDTLKKYAASNQWWDSTAPVVVYINGTVQNPASYTIDYDEGVVTFAAQVYDGAGVTVDYKHRLPTEIRDAMALLYANISEATRMVAGGLTSVRQVKVEEATIVYGDSKPTVLDDFTDARICRLLDPYRFRSIR